METMYQILREYVDSGVPVEQHIHELEDYTRCFPMVSVAIAIMLSNKVEQNESNV